MTDRFRLGVIGGDSPVAQRAVYPAVSESERVEIVAASSDSGLPEHLSDVARPSYEAVIEDPRVEAVYIPLPNSLHRTWAERAAEAGKHVLCEQPIATNVADAAAMYAAANRAGVLLAEAYVTPFHPRSAAITSAVMGGSIGLIRSVTAEFTLTISPDGVDDHRWLHHRGGGALWGVGIYTVSPIRDALPDAAVVNVMSTRADSGVDSTTIIDFATSAGAGQAICSLELPGRQRLVYRATGGTLSMDDPFTPGPGNSSFRIDRPDGSFEEVDTASANPHLVMLEAFASACRGDTDWPRDQAEVLKMIGQLAEIAAMQPVPGIDDAVPTPGSTT